MYATILSIGFYRRSSIMNITTEKVKNGNGRLHTNESECIKYKSKWESSSSNRCRRSPLRCIGKGTAKAYQCNVLDKSACLAVAEEDQKDFGPCDILVNGVGGNNPKATTDMEYFEPDSIERDMKSFCGMKTER